MIPLCVPFAGCKLYDIISNSNDQICLIQYLILVILKRNTDAPHTVGIVIRNNSLGHHGMDYRYFQSCYKFCQCFSRTVPDCRVSCENNRFLSLVDHSGCHFDHVKGRYLMALVSLFQRQGCRSFRDLHGCDVTRQIYMAGTRLFTFRIFKCQSDNLIHGIGLHDLLASFGDRFK